ASAKTMQSQTPSQLGYNPQLDPKTHGFDLTIPAFVTNLELLAKSNTKFRTVLYTDHKHQIVLMALPFGTDIGEEIHLKVDQFFRIEKGEGTMIIDGRSVEVKDGYGIDIPAGTRHNLIAKTNVKLYTIYSPPNHNWDVIDRTKTDALLRETEQ